MGSVSNERKTARPKLRLTEQAEQADVEGDSGDGMALFFVFHLCPLKLHVTPPSLPTGILYSPQVSLASRDQDGGLSNSTIDIYMYDLTEKLGGTVNSLMIKRIMFISI